VWPARHAGRPRPGDGVPRAGRRWGGLQEMARSARVCVSGSSPEQGCPCLTCARGTRCGC
jgi:hypothetical protein